MIFFYEIWNKFSLPCKEHKLVIAIFLISLFLMTSAKKCQNMSFFFQNLKSFYSLTLFFWGIQGCVWKIVEDFVFILSYSREKDQNRTEPNTIQTFFLTQRIIKIKAGCKNFWQLTLQVPMCILHMTVTSLVAVVANIFDRGENLLQNGILHFVVRPIVRNRVAKLEFTQMENFVKKGRALVVIPKTQSIIMIEWHTNIIMQNVRNKFKN